MSISKDFNDAVNTLRSALRQYDGVIGKEHTDDVKLLIEEARKDERHKIGKLLGNVANQVFNSAEPLYPSNLLDVINAWLNEYELGGGHKDIEDWFLLAIKNAEEK